MWLSGVILAKAGIQGRRHRACGSWIPASAGMTLWDQTSANKKDGASRHRPSS